jgi:hypothetical protein
MAGIASGQPFPHDGPIFDAVKDEQPFSDSLGARLEPAFGACRGNPDVLLVLFREIQEAGEPGESGNEILTQVGDGPEAEAIVGPMERGIFQRRLGLTHAAEPLNGLREGGEVARRKHFLESMEVFITPREVGVWTRNVPRLIDIARRFLGGTEELSQSQITFSLGCNEARIIPKEVGPVSDIFGPHDYRNELMVAAVGLVKVEADNGAFPGGATASRRLLAAFGAAAIGLGADNENEIGLVDLVVHPNRPAFGDPVLVLIDNDRAAILAKAVRQGQNRGFVFRRIVAVTDKYARAFRGHQIYYARPGLSVTSSLGSPPDKIRDSSLQARDIGEKYSYSSLR